MQQLDQISPAARLKETASPGSQQIRRSLTLAGILLGWAVVVAGSTKIVEKGWVADGPLVWVIAAVPVLAGVFLLLAFRRYLRDSDELQRLVQLQALAWGFGGSVVGMAAYRLFSLLGAPAADTGDFIVVMAVLYSLGSVLGWRRYL